MGEREGSGPHTRETPGAPAGEEPEPGRKDPPAPPLHTESSSGWRGGGAVLPAQGHDLVSRRFMYSCKAFRRASISAMSAAWWSELYSVSAGERGECRGCEGPICCPQTVGQGKGGHVESQAHL